MKSNMEKEPLQVTPTWGNDKWSDPDAGSQRTAESGSDAPTCSRLDYERATVCRLAEERGEFVTDVDGFVYWWPSAKPEHAGHLSPYQLRVLADELDRRNAPWQSIIDAEFSSENA